MIYHSIHPNKALEPLPNNELTILEQQDNEVAWSQLLVSRILPLVLPPEDLQNPCLQVLVSEIFSEIIVYRAICGKASEPWVVWEGVTKLIYSLWPDSQQPPSADAISMPINRLEQFGLLSSGKAQEPYDLQSTPRAWLDSIAKGFWSILQLMMIGWLLLRSFTIALMHGSSIPARQSRMRTLNPEGKVHISAVASDSRPSPQHTVHGHCERRPVISLRIWTCVLRLIALDMRMPWFSGFLSLLQWHSLYGPGKICITNSLLDR